MDPELQDVKPNPSTPPDNTPTDQAPVVRAPLIPVAIVGLIAPTALVFLILIAVGTGPLLLAGSFGGLVQMGGLAKPVAALLYSIPFLLLLLLPAWGLVKLYDRWGVPQSKRTVYCTLLSILALDASVLYLNLSFGISELIVSIGGIVLALMNLAISYMQIGKLKTTIQIIIIVASIIVTGAAMQMVIDRSSAV